MAYAYKSADDLAQQVTQFFAAAVGKGIDRNAEFCVLTQWLDAIDAAINAARAACDRIADDHFCAMRVECSMWLDHWAT